MKWATNVLLPFKTGRLEICCTFISGSMGTVCLCGRVLCAVMVVYCALMVVYCMPLWLCIVCLNGRVLCASVNGRVLYAFVVVYCMP